MAIIKKTKKQNQKDLEDGEFLHTVGGNVN
jgi:hypothetical protein